MVISSPTTPEQTSNLGQPLNQMARAREKQSKR